MLLTLTLLILSPARAACPSSAVDLQGRVDEVLDSYIKMDEPGYERANLALHRELECLMEHPPRELVRDVHLVTALDRFLLGEREAALSGLRAVLDLSPDYRLSADLAPPGHPLATLLEQARTQGPNPRQRLLRPIEGVFYLDSQPMADRPQQQPALVQWATIDHEVCWTGYLDPGVGLPIDIVTSATEPGALERCIADQGRLQGGQTAAPVLAEDVPHVSPEPAPEPALAQIDPDPPQPEAHPSSPIAADPTLTMAEPQLPAPNTPLDLTAAPPPDRPALFSPLPMATAGGLAVSGGLLVAALLSRHTLLAETERCAIEQECNLDPDAALERLGTLEDRTRKLGYAAQISGGVTASLGIAAGISLSF